MRRYDRLTVQQVLLCAHVPTQMHARQVPLHEPQPLTDWPQGAAHPAQSQHSYLVPE
jgi:hypothetical protein